MQTHTHTHTQFLPTGRSTLGTQFQNTFQQTVLTQHVWPSNNESRKHTYES